MQKAMRQAVRAARMRKYAKRNTIRNHFVTHLVEAGYDISTMQELLGHRDVTTEQI